MAIEVELKARVRDRAAVLERLGQDAEAEASVYRDTYYDWPDGRLAADGRQELRVRVVERTDGSHTVLTYKATPLDGASQPEHETRIDDATSLEAILDGLGLTPVLSFEKHCLNHRLRAKSREITATVVQVPELGDQTFIEVETLVSDDADDVPDATGVIRHVLEDLGLGEHDLTDELYTDAVRRHRAMKA